MSDIKPAADTFTPALGQHWLTPLYDVAIRTLTRESVWRLALANQVDPRDGDGILDVGCGTGTFLTLLANRAPKAHLVGIDPDPEVLARARLKAAKAGASIEFVQGFLSEDVVTRLGPLTKVVSSLVLHQVPLAEKLRILSLMRRALADGGEAHIADYGAQTTPVMRWLFQRTVQSLDGRENTQPNADGVLPDLMREAGFRQVEERAKIPTPTGSISIYWCAA
jgi:ubiquinone/menaquinone biosynthesis C-methylase UbiE